MTISEQPLRADYTCDGATTAFSVPFSFVSGDQLLVTVTDTATPPVETVLTYGIGYTTTGGAGDVGWIHTTTAPAVNDQVHILAAVPLTQETDFQSNEVVPAETQEGVWDKGIRIDRQQQEEIDRSLKYTTGYTGPPMTGQDFEQAVADVKQDTIDAENAAAAAAASAAQSASSASASAGSANQSASSAAAAALSASNAAASEVQAANDATAADASAAKAKTSETNAKTSETNAASSAGASAGSANQAASSAGQAASSAAAASTSAGNAAASASSASGFAASSQNSAIAAQGSAASALGAAGQASTSATQAKTSETNAAGSAAAAAASATAAQVAKVNWRGIWNAVTNYSAHDAVEDAGSSWVATVASTNAKPSTTPADWDLMAQRGQPGAPGAGTGDMLAANNLSDVEDPTASRTNLGLGNSATRNVGTVAGTVMAGDDARVTGSATNAYVDAQDALKVSKAGDTMTGVLQLKTTQPFLALNKTGNGSGFQNVIQGLSADKPRWMALFGNQGAESGANVGSDFEIVRYDDAGNYLGEALNINRANAAVNFYGATYVAGSINSTGPTAAFGVADQSDAAFSWNFYSGGHAAYLWNPTHGNVLSLSELGTLGVAGVVTATGFTAVNSAAGAYLTLQSPDAQQAVINLSASSGTKNWQLGRQSGGTFIIYDSFAGVSPISITPGGPDIACAYPVQLPADPLNPLEAATKRYVDAGVTGKVSKAGDTMTGALHITDGTASNATNQGALTVAGGLGVIGNVVAGGIVSSTGQINLNNTVFAIDSTPWRMIYTQSGAAAIFLGDASTSATVIYRAASHYFQNPAGDTSFLTMGAGGATFNIPITSVGEVTAYYSDERLKKDISVIPDALEKVKALRGVYYNQSDLAAQFGFDNHRRQVGVIAQDVQAVLPEAIRPAPFDINDKGESKSGQEYLTVQYDNLVPLLLEAIKELTQRLERLEK